jgi:major membrane immunogen (membrane-anchored lipoprotein)
VRFSQPSLVLVKRVVVMALNLRSLCCGVSIVAASILLTGCGSSGPELAKVTGKVTLDGQPVHGAAITFRPQGEKGSTSYGGTNKDGIYTLMFTRDSNGAMPGDYFVDIETQKLAKSEIDEMKAQGLAEPPAYVPIPKKYRSGPDQLKATVKAGQTNEINFELTSK